MTGTFKNGHLKELSGQLREGKIDRREFVRFAALLGMSAVAAYGAAGISAPAMAASLPFPADDPKAKTGGTLRVGQRVAKMEDPATYSWNEMSNQSRPIIEYMTMVSPDNVTRPMLLESWEPSDDLKTWTLRVRKGVMWHNGEELIADHLAWNILRWTDSGLGSSIIGLSTFNALATPTGEKNEKGKPVLKPTPGGVKVIDRYTLQLNLSKPVLSVAQDCAEYPALIVHPSFKPPFSDNPIGTGPYTLSELKVGERCVIKRISKTTDGKDFTYWGGKTYLDEIHFFNFSQDNQAAALASGNVDAIYELTAEQLELAKSVEGAEIGAVDTAQTLCCRMQTDAKPFSDIRVRQAIVKSIDNAAVKDVVFPDRGGVGQNFHVAPVHPEYVPLPPLKRDIAGAKKLLKDAGFETGLEITIDVGNTDGVWQQAICESLRDQLKDAGITLSVNVLPTTKFWDIWTKTAFGATSWAHRPLGTMALAQAYRTGVPWNESHFSDPAFDEALAEAEGTLDVTKRKEKMAKAEQILQDAAVVIQSVWRPVYSFSSKKVHGFQAHPARAMQLNKVWMS